MEVAIIVAFVVLVFVKVITKVILWRMALERERLLEILNKLQ